MKRDHVPDGPSGSERNARSRVKVPEPIREKLAQADHWRARDEKGAWALLCSLANGKPRAGGRRLSGDDAMALARGMHELLEELDAELRDKRISKAAICAQAFAGATDSKELYRLTLPPSANPQVRELRKDGAKYRELIKALAKLTGHSAHDLSYRLLRKTPLHPTRQPLACASQLDLVATALEELVRRLAIEYRWHETYERTARIKLEALARGDHCCWPLYDLDPEMCGLIEKDRVASYDGDVCAALDPSQAYGRPQTHSRLCDQALLCFGQGQLQDDEFFYVPHATIGHLLLWDLPDPRKDMAAYRVARDRELMRMRASGECRLQPADDWDAERRCPVGQTSTGLENTQLQYYSWLLAYPDPHGEGVVPCLYQPCEESGAFLMPLDTRSLAWLSQAVWLDADRDLSFLDRLEELLTDFDQTGMCSFERQLRKTARWLEFNPVLVRHAAAQARRERLLRSLIQPQRVPDASGPA